MEEKTAEIEKKYAIWFRCWYLYGQKDSILMLVITV